MRFGRNQTPTQTVVLFLTVLLSPSIAQPQTPAGRLDPSKAQGGIRIGLVTPRVNLIGGGSVSQETVSLRQNVSSYLTGPRIGTVDLKARLDSLALEEGKERDCDYVFYVSLIRKRQQTGTYGEGTKSGDEITFEFRLVSTDGLQTVVTNVAKAKVQYDGEDVITPMIEAAAEAVVKVAKPKMVVQSSATVEKPKIENVTSAQRPNSTTTPTTNQTVASPRAESGYGSLTASPRLGSTTTTVSDPPKAADAIRLGMVIPRVTVVSSAGAGSNESASLRQAVSSYLIGSTIEVIDLRARLESLALDEGKRRQCDYVLYKATPRVLARACRWDLFWEA